ncbi:MAG: asparagine synthase (glutamine-hydrolyzing) [Lachnospiraceae bacterium]|nr:asparagine synthase (glutamine-hydrolyzing) [Lachnospiraceae bacterium]
MCGICGTFDHSDRTAPDEKILRRMLNAIRHRGPDGDKIVIRDNVGFAFNRLSFLDLSGGMQPIPNEDESIIMMCNGEIFNYMELREDLEKKGHRMRTKTDVEVIVHLYEEYGPDFVNMLNGQFAIAVYDTKKQTLLLYRDHMGICPLFYTRVGDTFVFASEIKAILEYPGVERRLNLDAVEQLMNYPGIVSPITFFKGISSLAGGHRLIVTRDGIKNEEYWDLIYSPEEEDLGEEYYVEKLRELLKKAITRRLFAEVPVGFYVSGGLDSSVVACFIGKFLKDRYFSFSAEIGDGDLNEKEFQKLVQERVSSQHFCVRVAEEEIWNRLSNVIYHCESGVKESYDVAAYMLSELVHDHGVKAVLTGQGSDELFCGYAGYMLDAFRGMQTASMSEEERRSNEMLWGDPLFRFERIHPEIQKIHKQIFRPEMWEQIEASDVLKTSPINTDKVRGLSNQKRRSYIDCKLRLGDHLLGEHGDRMFFSHSVEGRHPFLDREIIEFVRTLPDKYKIDGTNEKYILKKAGVGIVPDKILKRRKFPFQAPGMSALVKTRQSQDFLQDDIINKYGLFNLDKVKQMKADYAVDGFKLMGAYEIDYLMIVMTVTMLCEHYSLTV